MAPSAPRTSRPWVALVVAVVALVAALAVLRLLGDDEPESGARLDGVSLEQPDTPAMDLTAPEQSGGKRTVEPIPGVAERQAALDKARAAATDDPVLVFGLVVDGAKQPLPDIDVTLYDDLGDYLDTATSDEQGEFSFTWDEPLGAGWSVATDPDPLADPDEASSTVPAFYVHDSPIVPGDSPVRVELVVARAPRLEGIVLDSLTGEPIELADIEVVVTAVAYVDEYQDAYTEEDGTFALSLVDIPARGVLVRATDDEGRVAIQGPFDLQPGESRYLEFRMGEGVTIEGTVYDGASGLPLENVEVYLLAVHPMFDAGDGWDVTAEDGSFLLEDVAASPDRLWLYVLADENGPTVVQVADPRRPVDIRLGDVVSVKGRIVEAGGDGTLGVADAELRFVLRGPYGAIEDFSDETFSDEDGHFELDLESVPADAAEVFVEAPGYVRRRVHLSDLVPTQRDWREYEFVLELESSAR